MIRVLGYGGSATVYLARDNNLPRVVAVKVPHANLLRQTQTRERFLQEARMVAGLRHPNIVEIHQIGEANGLPFLVFEYCDGGSLAEWLANRQHPVAVQTCAEISKTLAHAVQHAHTSGILHRDLNPRNVLLVADWARSDDIDAGEFPFVAKLSDFGVGTWVDADQIAVQTQTGTVLGTIPYMAPEQASGTMRFLQPTVDIHALGVILYELLTGLRPYRAPTLVEILQQIQELPPVPPGKLRAGIPRDLETICLKCLEKSPAQRYASAGLLAEDLQRFLDGRPIMASPTPPWERWWRWCRRNAIVSSLAGIVVLAGLGLLVGLALHWRMLGSLQGEILQRNIELTKAVQEREQSLQTVRRLHHQSVTKAGEVQDLLYVSDVQRAADAWRRKDPAQLTRALAPYAAGKSLHPWMEFGGRYLSSQFSGSERLIAREGKAYWHITFSPDGRLLAASGSDGRVELFETECYSLVQSLETGQKEVNSAAFSPSGKMLATAGDDGRVCIWDLETRQLRRAIPVFQQLAVFGVKYVLGGEQIAACGKSAEIGLWDAATGEHLGQLKGVHEIDSNGIPDIEAITVSPDGRLLASAGHDGRVAVWNLETQKVLTELRPDTRRLLCVAFSPKGTQLATGGLDSEIKIWNVASGKLLSRRPMAEAIQSVTFGLDRTLIAGDRSGALAIWPLNSQGEMLEQTAVWPAHQGQIQSIAVSPRNRQIVSSARSGEVREWRISPQSKSRELASRRLKLNNRDRTSVVMTPCSDGNQIIWAGAWGIEQWNVRTGVLQQSHLSGKTVRAVATRGSVTIAGTDQGELYLWKKTSPELNQPLMTLAGLQFTKLGLLPDGQRLVAVTNQLELLLIDLTSREIVHRIPDCRELAIDPQGRYLAVMHEDNVLALYETTTLQGDGPRVKYRQTVASLAFTNDGSALATGGHDRLITLRDVPTLKLRREFAGHRDYVVSLALSPDGRSLATSDRRGFVKLWHVPTGLELFELDQLKSTARHLEFSLDGRQLYALTDEKALLIYDSLPPDLTSASANP